MAAFGYAYQSLALSLHETPASTVASQAVALALTQSGNPAFVQAAQSVAVAVRDGSPIPQASQAVALVLYRTDVPSDFTPRAFGFTFDGHAFYALTLGSTLPTLVYDLTTDQWSQWSTEGFWPAWNFTRGGVEWNGQVFGAALFGPEVWRIDPTAAIDEGFRPLRRVVTGTFDVRGRDAISCAAVRLTASVGAPQTEPATVALRFSDDQARTWSVRYEQRITPQDWGQEVAWRSLGLMKAPGRVFEIEDFGGLVRIDDATIDGPG